MTINELNGIMVDLRDLRDDQDEIQCPEGECICADFDAILDQIEKLQNKFKKHNADEIKRFQSYLDEDPDMEHCARQGYLSEIAKLEENTYEIEGE